MLKERYVPFPFSVVNRTAGLRGLRRYKPCFQPLFREGSAPARILFSKAIVHGYTDMYFTPNGIPSALSTSKVSPAQEEEVPAGRLGDQYGPSSPHQTFVQ